LAPDTGHFASFGSFTADTATDDETRATNRATNGSMLRIFMAFNS
jgi:hypothetical protein